MKKDVHVVPHNDGWAVKRGGADRASSVHQTQGEAMEKGRETAKREKVELVHQVVIVGHPVRSR